MFLMRMLSGFEEKQKSYNYKKQKKKLMLIWNLGKNIIESFSVWENVWENEF